MCVREIARLGAKHRCRGRSLDGKVKVFAIFLPVFRGFHSAPSNDLRTLIEISSDEARKVTL